jgi:hypothetical protein
VQAEGDLGTLGHAVWVYNESICVLLHPVLDETKAFC